MKDGLGKCGQSYAKRYPDIYKKANEVANGKIDVMSEKIVDMALSPLYDEIENLTADIPAIGKIAKQVLSKYGKYQEADKIANTLKDQITKSNSERVKDKLNKDNKDANGNIDNTKPNFNWEYETYYATLEVLSVEATKLTNDFLDKANQYIAEKLGGKIGKDLADTLTSYFKGNIQAYMDGNMLKWKDTLWDSTHKTLSEEEFNQLYGAVEKEFKNVEDAMIEDAQKKVDIMVQEAKIQMNDKFAQIRAEALVKITNSMSDMATDFAGRLFSQVTDKSNKLGSNLGKIGNACVTNITNQVTNWATGEIQKFVVKTMTDFFFGSMGGQSLFNVAGLKFEGLKIDWTSVAIDVLISCFEDNETVQILASLGILYFFNTITFHDTGYDTYNNMYYMFSTLGNWLIPTLKGSASYGAPRIQGLAPTQFQDWFDATLRVMPGIGIPVINRLEVPIVFNELSNMGLFSAWVLYPGPILIDYLPYNAITNTYSSFIPISSKRIGGESTYLSDAAYILCEMDSNYCADSYVQRALSQTGIYRGATYEEDYMSEALNAEAAKYSSFREQASSYNGYVNSIQDNTETAKVLYDRWNSAYIFGPFKVDYIHDFVYTDLRGKVDFGFIYDMEIYDQDGNKIDKNYWNITFSDDTKLDRLTNDEDYNFPYPNEEFYIELMNYGDNNIQSISKIEIKYKEMQAQASYQDLLSWYYMGMWHEYINKVKFYTGASTWIWHFEHYFTYADIAQINKSAITVDNAVKYYLHHTQTITLQKNPSHGGYETETFTTTSTTVTDGRTELSNVNGGKLNSSLRESLTAAYALYKYSHPDEENEEEKAQKEKETAEQKQKMQDAIDAREKQIYDEYYGKIEEIGMNNPKATEKAKNKLLSDLRHLESQKLALNNLSQLYKTNNNKTTLEKRLESLSPTLNTINNAFASMANFNPMKDGLEVVLKNLNVNKDLMKVYNVYNVLNSNYMTDLVKTMYVANTLIDSKEGKYIINAVGTITAFANHNGGDILGMLSVVASSLGKTEYANSINNLTKMVSGLDSKTMKIATKVYWEALNYKGDDMEKHIKDLVNKYGEGLNEKEKQEAIKSAIKMVNYTDNNSDLGDLSGYAQKAQNTIDKLTGYKRENKDTEKKEETNSKKETTNSENEKTNNQKSAMENGLEVIKGIAGKDSDITKTIDKSESFFRGTSNTSKDEFWSTLIVAAQEMANGKSKEDAMEKAIKISKSNDQANVINKYIEATDSMTADQVKELVSQLSKSSNMDGIEAVLNTALERNAKMSDEEKTEAETRPYADTLAELTVLEDATPYIEYSPKFSITNIDRPNEVYWANDDELGMTIGVAGAVWKDGHSGLETDYDGIRGANANGDLELGLEGIKVTLVDRITGQTGKMYNSSGRKVDATTYTDSGGYYHIERVPVGEYDVVFEYDGQTYKATDYLAGGGILEYLDEPDLDTYDNNSKAIENASERRRFNERFNEIVNGYAIGKDGTKTALAYDKSGGESKLITLDDAGHVLPQFAMHASTALLGITYPIDDQFSLDNEDTTIILNGNKLTFHKAGEYMYHVNLGLIERAKADLAVTQDVYTVDTTINQKQETYYYDLRNPANIFDAKLQQTSAYRDISYTRELYKADYQFRIDDYQYNELNQLDRNEDDKKDEIAEIQRIKWNSEAWEERVFVTYKLTIKNQSLLQKASVNELVDYFDGNYSLVPEDLYMDIQDEEGKPQRKLVAKQSYYELNSGETGKITWTANSKTGGAELYPGFNTMYTTGLENILLSSHDTIDVYVTFEVDKGQNDALELGEKQNVMEITNYSTFERSATDKNDPEGLIDKDSEPGNSNPYYMDAYEDDNDAAPVLNLKLYENDGRTLDGYVWNDTRNKLLKTGQLVGNGIMDDGEEKIDGVRVQLVEKIDDPDTGEEYEYVWKEIYTGEDRYSFVQHGGAVANGAGQVNDYGSITTDTTMGSVNEGQYKFNEYIAGNFIVRFIYGDTPKTYLAEGYENSEGEGKNDVSYNGQDYKSTTYNMGYDVNNKWYDLSNWLNIDRRISDAKDDQTRRLKVIEYGSNLTNKKAEILSSFDGRADKKYYDTTKHQALRDNTWMFADTARFNIEGEYNETLIDGKEQYVYQIKNIDFGLEQRPETKVELKKEITSIRLTLANGETIIDTANGVVQNVNWVASKKNAVIKQNVYKRETKKYEYTQGKIHVYMDEEIMQGAKLEIDYRITVTNDSQIDYTGSDGSLGDTYYTGQESSSDKIATTKINKIIDYVDNSLVFRKVDNSDWYLVENMQEFIPDNIIKEQEEQLKQNEEIQKRLLENYLNAKRAQYGADFVEKNYDKLKEEFEKEQSSKKDIVEEQTRLDNTEVLKYMKEKGYLNPDLSIVQTKSARTEKQPITQVIATRSLEKNELKPGQSTTVDLTLAKTLSPNDDADSLSYRNIAEILEISNSAGRRDMDAVPGNQDPDNVPQEYDSDFTEQVIITPPTGQNKAYYFVLATVVLVILTVGIIVIKKRVLDRK